MDIDQFNQCNRSCIWYEYRFRTVHHKEEEEEGKNRKVSIAPSMFIVQCHCWFTALVLTLHWRQVQCGKQINAFVVVAVTELQRINTDWNRCEFSSVEFRALELSDFFSTKFKPNSIDEQFKCYEKRFLFQSLIQFLQNLFMVIFLFWYKNSRKIRPFQTTYAHTTLKIHTAGGKTSCIDDGKCWENRTDSFRWTKPNWAFGESVEFDKAGRALQQKKHNIK